MTALPQIKICGLTDVEQAVACAAAGADAIGLVFFEKSPRNVTIETAAAISSALPDTVIATGVFVNESIQFIMDRVNKCGLKAVQLHGNESPEVVSFLKKKNIVVIKALYLESTPEVDRISDYDADAFLVECAKGVLPGGNALSWNFSRVSDLQSDKPLIIAGGLSPDNITEAIDSSHADMVDVSSGVESSPGVKDINKVKAFISNVNACTVNKQFRRLF